jgi:hypothetical protein
MRGVPSDEPQGEFTLSSADEAKLPAVPHAAAFAGVLSDVYRPPDSDLLAAMLKIALIMLHKPTLPMTITACGLAQTPAMCSSLPVLFPDGDGSLIAKERTFISDLMSRARELKRKGVFADDVGKQLTAEFKTKFRLEHMNPIANLVRRVYAESQ